MSDEKENSVLSQVIKDGYANLFYENISCTVKFTDCTVNNTEGSCTTNTSTETRHKISQKVVLYISVPGFPGLLCLIDWYL